MGDNLFSLPAMVLDQFDRLPEVCWNESYTGMREFAFGDQDGPIIRALHRRNNGLERWIGNNTLDNAAALIKLARLGVLSSHVALVPERKSPTRRCEPLPRDGSLHGKSQGFLSEKLPYQLEFADKYVLNVSRCGHFASTDQRPNWYLWGESELSLEDPKAHQAEEGYKPTHFWPTEVVCPNWRILCGANEPPNLPPHLVEEGRSIAIDERAVWIPFGPHLAPIIKDVELDLSRGRLPDLDDDCWGLVQPDSDCCNVRAVRDLIPAMEDDDTFSVDIKAFFFHKGLLHYTLPDRLSAVVVPQMSRDAFPMIAPVSEDSPGFQKYRDRVRDFAKMISARRAYLAQPYTAKI